MDDLLDGLDIEIPEGPEQSSDPEGSPTAVGQFFGPYQLIEEVGRGGVAEVTYFADWDPVKSSYRARDVKLWGPSAPGAAQSASWAPSGGWAPRGGGWAPPGGGRAPEPTVTSKGRVSSSAAEGRLRVSVGVA